MKLKCKFCNDTGVYSFAGSLMYCSCKAHEPVINMNMANKQINKLQKHLDKNNNYHPTDKEIVYILGPMTGLPDCNFLAFFEAERILSQKGYCPINPARNVIGLTRKDYMQIDLQYIFASDSVYRLKGWEKSPGARVENALAEYLELNIYDE